MTRATLADLIPTALFHLGDGVTLHVIIEPTEEGRIQLVGVET